VKSLKIVAKVLKLQQKEDGDSNVTVSGYYVEEEKWDMRELAEENLDKDVITKLLEVAAEYMVKERASNEFLLTEVETTGLRVMLGEGGRFESSTVLIPKPSYLRRILFAKCQGENNCTVVYEFKPSSQIILYEGTLAVKNIDFDLAILECGDHVRVLFPHELVQPRTKLREKSVRKRKTRRKRKKKKSSSRKKRKSR